MTTGPLLVSRVRVLPSLLMSLRSLIEGSGLPRLFRVARHSQRDDLVGIVDRAVVVLRAGLDLVDDVHAGDDLAEDGVLPVEEAGVAKADEELRIGRVRVARPRHADSAALEMRRAEFAGQIGEIGPARAGAGRIAGLRHEARNDPVKDD